MAKLTVRNVGPIREAELEVKKHTVFIGPQGSGKSTLAKLIAIGGDNKLSAPSIRDMESLITKFNLNAFIDNERTYWEFNSNSYKLLYNNGLQFEFTDHGQSIIDKYLALFIKQNNDYSQILPLHDFRRLIQWNGNSPLYSGNIMAHSLNFYQQTLPKIFVSHSTLIPTERHLFPLFADSIWSLLNADINLPESVKAFGLEFERARNRKSQLQIPFLSIRYNREDGRDLIYYANNKAIVLSQSASGYQAAVPLLVTVEHQRQQSHRRFIIEEPELNLYPTAQKDLIYSLMGGLQPDVTYQEAEWVITTHSPYVLSSFNTLMLAYKVAQRSEDLRAEVEKIIPSRCWINPDEFAAYYVDNGTVRSIISEKTGMIADNELDDVSEDLAGEQDQLLELSRSVPRA
ncbi:hypothetical protein BH09BAC4_BH09BAC4_05350 [soil metagenome]